MPSTAEDQARLLISIEATQAKFAKQLAVIAKQAGDTATGIEKNFKRSNDNVGKAFGKGGKEAEQNLNRSRASAQQLSFQLNDIATQLLSGTSPFTVMAQQGGQVTQIINGAGGLRGAVGALGGAIANVLNPVGLLSVALIGITGVAVQYFAEWASSGQATSKEIEEQVKLIERIAEKWGDALPALRSYADEMKRAADEAERATATKLYVGKQYEQPRETAKLIIPDFTAARVDLQLLGTEASVIDDLQKAFDDLNAKMDANTATAEDVEKVQERLSKLFATTHLDSVGALANSFKTLAAETTLASTAAKYARDQNDALNVRTKALVATSELLTMQMFALGPAGVKAFGDIAQAATTGLGGSLTGLSDKLKTLMEDFEKLEQKTTASLNRLPFGQLSPLTSGGGKFFDANSEAFQKYQFNSETYRKAGESAAAAMIRGFETFSAKAYEDKRTSTGKFDAYRAGFGSDTATRANGAIEKVAKDTIVTLEDAQRDLARRIVEFQTGIQRAIGIDTWNSLAEGQQAALTSIAYNYGSLPQKIVDAIKSGGGPEVVAKAIAALTANPGRRKQEAQAYLGGTGYSMSDIGVGGKSPQDIFKGSVAQVEKRIAALNAEYDAQAKLNPLIKDYGFAQDQARIKAQLLADAQRAGLEITPQLAAQIDQLATNYARASSSSEKLAEKQKQIAQASAFFRDTFGQALMDLVPAIETGNAALDKLLNTLIEAVAQAALLGKGPLAALFGFGGGGIFGALFPFANGGIAKNGKPLKTFARGGVSRTAAIFGETGQAEAAVPLPDGRRIPVDLRVPKMPAMQESGGTHLTINAPINAPGADPAALARVEKSVQDLGKNIPKMVDNRVKTRDLRKVRA